TNKVDPECVIRIRSCHRDANRKSKCFGRVSERLLDLANVRDYQGRLDKSVIRDNVNRTNTLSLGNRQQDIERQVGHKRGVLSARESIYPGVCVRLPVLIEEL